MLTRAVQITLALAAVAVNWAGIKHRSDVLPEVYHDIYIAIRFKTHMGIVSAVSAER